MSDREIARRLGIPNTTASNIRRRLAAQKAPSRISIAPDPAKCSTGPQRVVVGEFAAAQTPPTPCSPRVSRSGMFASSEPRFAGDVTGG